MTEFAEVFWAVDYNVRDSLALDMFNEKSRRNIIHGAVKVITDFWEKEDTPRILAFWENILLYNDAGREFRSLMWGFSPDFTRRIAWDIVQALPDRFVKE
jgi:hypothetical protein